MSTPSNMVENERAFRQALINSFNEKISARDFRKEKDHELFSLELSDLNIFRSHSREALIKLAKETFQNAILKYNPNYDKTGKIKVLFEKKEANTVTFKILLPNDYRQVVRDAKQALSIKQNKRVEENKQKEEKKVAEEPLSKGIPDSEPSPIRASGKYADILAKSVPDSEPSPIAAPKKRSTALPMPLHRKKSTQYTIEKVAQKDFQKIFDDIGNRILELYQELSNSLKNKSHIKRDDSVQFQMKMNDFSDIRNIRLVNKDEFQKIVEDIPAKFGVKYSLKESEKKFIDSVVDFVNQVIILTLPFELIKGIWQREQAEHSKKGGEKSPSVQQKLQQKKPASATGAGIAAGTKGAVGTGTRIQDTKEPADMPQGSKHKPKSKPENKPRKKLGK